MKKNEIIEVDIIDNGFKGEGIAKYEDYTIFIPGLIKGEVAKVKILKVQKDIAYAKIEEIITKSKYRVEPDCPTYEKCGGCDLRHMSYLQTIRLKKEALLKTLRKELGDELDAIKINKFVDMDYPFYYRNKLQFPVGVGDDGKAIMGVYSERSHRIIPTTDCKIQNELAQEIAQSIIEFMNKNNIPAYDEKTLEGIVRHIIIRTAYSTEEIMITLVVNNMAVPKEKELVKFLTQKYRKIKTIVKNLNDQNTNVILGDTTQVIYGDGYIFDYLGEYRFKISPLSFYQVNPIQTEKLYDVAINKAKLTGKENVFDLYCGIGTIGLFASRKANKVYGIEVIPEAIVDAKRNAVINNVKNIEFIAGEVESELPKILKEENISPDVVFVDPPRKGCAASVIKKLLEVKPSKIIYISCNPATLARDLKLLSEGYSIKEITPVDQFCYTHHVECVASLKLK
jgi:23S rRNA (uracil1939-C5)-methyltransferase